MQKKLVDDGYESPRSGLPGRIINATWRSVLKAARAARENQWQVLLE